MADVSMVNAQIQQDPEVQAFLHQIQGLNPEQVKSIPYLMSVVPGLVQKLSPQAQSLINSVPQDYVWDWQSQGLKKKSFNDRNPWFLPVVALGTAGLGAGLVPGVAGFGGAGGGASSVAGDVAKTAGSALGTTPAWEQIAKIAAPIGATALMNHTSGSGSGTGSALDPTQQSLMNKLLQMGVDRMQSTIPVHDAAMRLAQSMAPTGAPNPRMDQAIAQAQTPRPQTAMSPQALEAIQRLMAQVPH